MQFCLESPIRPDVVALIAELDAYLDALYPAEARYALSPDALDRSHVLFVVARHDSGAAAGCGAIVMTGAAGELKRMYVRPADRSGGVAARILALLEDEAANRGCRSLRLETGPHQPEALAFYEKKGFRVRKAFGSYREHPLSVFMEKRLAGE